MPQPVASDFLVTTRTSYDAIAVDYAEHFADELADRPVEHSMLALFASQVDGPVLDVGCGTGLITRPLIELGIDVTGLDLSPGMLAAARSATPTLRCTVGSMLALPFADDTYAGVQAWYSTIHVPDPLLPTAFAELARVLRPGGLLSLAFQVGDEPRYMDSALGHDIELVFHRRQPELVAALLADAGLTVWTRTVRAALPGELTPHAFVLARKPH